MKQPLRRRFARECKIEAARMALTGGRTQKAVADDVGISPDTLYRRLSTQRKSFCPNAGSR